MPRKGDGAEDGNAPEGTVEAEQEREGEREGLFLFLPIEPFSRRRRHEFSFSTFVLSNPPSLP